MLYVRNDHRRPWRDGRQSMLRRALMLLCMVVIALLAACGSTQEQSFEENLDEEMDFILSWLEERTTYAVPENRPPVTFTTTEEINRIYYTRAYTNQNNVVAVFAFEDEKIYLPNSGGIRRKRAYLVHELAHWLQLANDAYHRHKDVCGYWAEIEAYTLHIQWMREYAYPEYRIEQTATKRQEFQKRCQSWAEIRNGQLLWDLTGVFYCQTAKDAEVIFTTSKAGISLDMSIRHRNNTTTRKSCRHFRSGDVGLVTELVESEFRVETGILRLVEIRVRNEEDGGKFTKTLWAISPYEFSPSSVQ